MLGLGWWEGDRRLEGCSATKKAAIKGRGADVRVGSGRGRDRKKKAVRRRR